MVYPFFVTVQRMESLVLVGWAYRAIHAIGAPTLKVVAGSATVQAPSRSSAPNWTWPGGTASGLSAPFETCWRPQTAAMTENPTTPRAIAANSFPPRPEP